MTKQSDNLHKLKVIASEDWNGMREDFKMASDTITFRVDYAPRVGHAVNTPSSAAPVLTEITR